MSKDKKENKEQKQETGLQGVTVKTLDGQIIQAEKAFCLNYARVLVTLKFAPPEYKEGIKGILRCSNEDPSEYCIDNVEEGPEAKELTRLFQEEISIKNGGNPLPELWIPYPDALTNWQKTQQRRQSPEQLAKKRAEEKRRKEQEEKKRKENVGKRFSSFVNKKTLKKLELAKLRTAGLVNTLLLGITNVDNNSGASMLKISGENLEDETNVPITYFNQIAVDVERSGEKAPQVCALCGTEHPLNGLDTYTAGQNGNSEVKSFYQMKILFVNARRADGKEFHTSNDKKNGGKKNTNFGICVCHECIKAAKDSGSELKYQNLYTYYKKIKALNVERAKKNGFKSTIGDVARRKDSGAKRK